MNDSKQFPDFKNQDNEGGKKNNDTVLLKDKNGISTKLKNFYNNKISKNSFVKKIETILRGNDSGDLDALSGIKKKNSIAEKVNLALMVVLIVVLFFSWKNTPALLAQADQLKNDLLEQDLVIEMENKNNEFLKKLNADRNKLVKNIHTVYSAVPDSDEKAEEIIAMLEDVAYKSRMVIDSIGIRELPETQFFHDDLVGVVQPYEYTFSIESGLPNILSFIESIRNSLRLMDIMSMEIEEGKGVYKATFSIYTYHLVGNSN